jgi:2-oxoisovalerate dehydrogenase E1 component
LRANSGGAKHGVDKCSQYCSAWKTTGARFRFSQCKHPAEISRLVSGFPNFHFEEIDGTDPVVAYAALKRAADHCRAGHGPAFVHAHVIRPYSHSLSDDERLYRPDSERQRDAARDPISCLQMFLLREGILDEKSINKIEKDVDEEVQGAADRAIAAPIPQPDTIYNYVYSLILSGPSGFKYATAFAAPRRRGRQTFGSLQPKTMADLINSTLRDEMRRDERIMSSAKMWPTPRGIHQAKLIKGKGGGLLTRLTDGVWFRPRVQFPPKRTSWDALPEWLSGD